MTFPDPLAWDLVVTLGAPWPRRDIAGWARTEVEFLARRHAAGLPTLGICFGGQLLAEALGATTTTMPLPRIGWYPVTPLVGEVGPGPWFQWHGDRLTAPPGAELLATSEDGTEAFRCGRSMALGFHPEMTPRLLRRWLSLPGGPPAGVDPDVLLAETERHVARAAEASRTLLDLLAR